MRLPRLRRLASMQPAELRFRTACELRKAAGRIRIRISTPRWDRGRLHRRLTAGAHGPWAAARAALLAGDYHAAHAQLGLHFARRASPFPLAARELEEVAEAIRGDFPHARAEAKSRAEALLQGRYDLLGYADLALGSPPDWHADPVHSRRAPRRYWAAVPYLDPASGDHKIIWELNRHQHWLALGRAFALSHDGRYYAAFQAQHASWLTANPPLIGINWASMLELALRSLSWLWALELFAGAARAEDPEPWIVDLLLALDRQLTHVEHNLSHYFSPNTHLSGEALALYVAGLCLPELRASARRVALGRTVLLREAARQIRQDGGHAELSAHYHRYSTDFYLLAAIVARRAGDAAADTLVDAAARQARYLRTIADDRGVRPALGDDDGGQLFPMCGRSSADCSDTLATAAVLLDEPALAVGPPPEETYWLCGVGARAAAAAPEPRTPSVAQSGTGYFISRTHRGDHLVFDAGPYGFLNGGHAHADALSCTLTVAGRPLLIDPGTATYTMDPEVRDRFRSTPMHNTLVLAGRSQADPRGPFHWTSAPAAEAPIWRVSADCDYVEGTHAAYAPYRHTRALLSIHGIGWLVVDHVLGGGTVAIDGYWHLHPAWECAEESPRVCRLRNGNTVLALASSVPLQLLRPGSNPLAQYSPAYGAIEPAPVLQATSRAAVPATMVTFIPAVDEFGRRLQVEVPAIAAAPSDEWHACACQLRCEAGSITVLAAVEGTGIATSDAAAPSARWGTAELQTDARVAVLVERRTGARETVLVNGAYIAARGQSIVSLARRAPLLRHASSTLAPSVHEVGAV